MFDTTSGALAYQTKFINQNHQLMQTFMNQQSLDLGVNNSKVFYRKNNIDFKVPRAIGSKPSNASLYFNNRANETRFILREHPDSHPVAAQAINGF